MGTIKVQSVVSLIRDDNFAFDMAANHQKENSPSRKVKKPDEDFSVSQILEYAFIQFPTIYYYYPIYLITTLFYVHKNS